MSDYYTPGGQRAWYTDTPFGLRQHLTLDGMWPAATMCGHLAGGNWSNVEIRTPIGMTCRWCIRRVTKHGTPRTAPLGYLWFLPAGIAYVTDRFRRRKRALSRGAEVSVIDAGTLFDNRSEND